MGGLPWALGTGQVKDTWVPSPVDHGAGLPPPSGLPFDMEKGPRPSGVPWLTQDQILC